MSKLEKVEKSNKLMFDMFMSSQEEMRREQIELDKRMMKLEEERMKREDEKDKRFMSFMQNVFTMFMPPPSHMYPQMYNLPPPPPPPTTHVNESESEEDDTV